MVPKINTAKFKVSENLIFLRGKHGDMVVGNGNDYNPIYIENGDVFLKMLDNITQQDIGSIEQNLLDLLHEQKILSTKSEDLKKPPHRTLTCCGRVGEQTLILPLT